MEKLKRQTVKKVMLEFVGERRAAIQAVLGLDVILAAGFFEMSSL